MIKGREKRTVQSRPKNSSQSILIAKVAAKSIEPLQHQPPVVILGSEAEFFGKPSADGITTSGMDFNRKTACSGTDWLTRLLMSCDRSGSCRKTRISSIRRN